MPTPTVHNFFSWRPKTKTSIVQHLLCCMVSVLLLFVVLLLLLFFIVLYCYCIFEIAKVPLMTSCSLSLRGKWDFFLVKENKKIKKFHLVSKRQKNIMGGGIHMKHESSSEKQRISEYQLICEKKFHLPLPLFWFLRFSCEKRFFPLFYWDLFLFFSPNTRKNICL